MRTGPTEAIPAHAALALPAVWDARPNTGDRAKELSTLADMWRPEDLADLTPELRALVNTWDPIGIADIRPDEYNYLTGLILARLGRGDDRASFCEFMSIEAANLGTSAESGDAFGAVVFAWFSSRQPSPEDEPSSSRTQLRKGRRYRSSHWNS